VSDADAIVVIKFLAKNELADLVFIMERDGELEIAENCNDLFYWASADMEEITVGNLPVYEQAITDCLAAGFVAYAGTVFACRMRKMRPQIPCYAHYPKQIWPLLDACGPARPETGSWQHMEQRWEEKAPPYWKK